MENLDFEKKAAAAKSLELCAGWQVWFKPEMENRMAEIQNELVGPVKKKRTMELRMEYRILKDLVGKPERTLKVLKTIPMVPGPAGG